MSRYYLAYGSNLSLAQMCRRCPDAVHVGYGFIRGYQLLFKGSGSGNYLTIEKKRGRYVPVVVWKISEDDEAALDIYEGAPRFYYKETMPIEVLSMMDDSPLSTVDALVYIMHEERLKGCPTYSYYNVCLEGYHRFGLPEKCLEKAVIDSVGKRAGERFLDAVDGGM